MAAQPSIAPPTLSTSLCPLCPFPPLQARADAEALHQEQTKLELQQQALKYERRIQELEVLGVQGGGIAGECCPRGRVVGAAAAAPPHADIEAHSLHMPVIE